MFDRRRPDLELGVFETLLVVDGRPVELDAHLARLDASLRALYPHLTPPPLDVPVERGQYGHRSAGTSNLESLRLTVAPDGRGKLAARVERRGAQQGAEVTLASLPLQGGLGAHKWADRSLLEEAQAHMPADALPLVVDRDGAVLEASRASVFAVRRGALFTPPLDGRILPGITRGRVLAIAAVTGLDTHEAELSRQDLLDADEVFLTGSVRGIEPVDALDGTELVAAGDVTARLAAELRRTWIDGSFG